MSYYAIVYEADSTELHWLQVLLTSSADLTFDLCSPYPVEIDYRRRATSTDRGFIGRRLWWEEGDLRTFRMSWNSANMADAARLKYLWDATNGPNLPMNYTPPGESSAILVQFGMDQLRIVRRNAVAYAFDVVLEEVR